MQCEATLKKNYFRLTDNAYTFGYLELRGGWRVNFSYPVNSHNEFLFDGATISRVFGS